MGGFFLSKKIASIFRIICCHRLYSLFFASTILKLFCQSLKSSLRRPLSNNVYSSRKYSAQNAISFQPNKYLTRLAGHLIVLVAWHSHWTPKILINLSYFHFFVLSRLLFFYESEPVVFPSFITTYK